MVVHAETLEPDALVEAMHRGDFYASSGVRLASIEHDSSSYSLTIEADEGVRYVTEFVGTRRLEGAAVGEVLATVEGDSPSYIFSGDELYVRAKVTSDRVHPRPYEEGDVECAWLQPVVLAEED